MFINHKRSINSRFVTSYPSLFRAVVVLVSTGRVLFCCAFFLDQHDICVKHGNVFYAFYLILTFADPPQFSCERIFDMMGKINKARDFSSLACFMCLWRANAAFGRVGDKTIMEKLELQRS